MLIQGIYQFVRGEEGGTANLKGDAGKLTKYGVTQAYYNGFRDRKGFPRRTVIQISEDETFSVYEEFWNSAQCDLLDWPINIAHFTFAFNSGTEQAIRILQRALNLQEDGILGPISRSAIKYYNTDPMAKQLLTTKLLLEQVFFYDSLDENHPEKTNFVTNFWLKRIKHVTREIAKGMRV